MLFPGRTAPIIRSPSWLVSSLVVMRLQDQSFFSDSQNQWRCASGGPLLGCTLQELTTLGPWWKGTEGPLRDPAEKLGEGGHCFELQPVLSCGLHLLELQELGNIIGSGPT